MYEDWAQLLVEYSMNVEEGDLVEVTYGPPARPLALAVHRELVRVGAHPTMNVDDQEFSRAFYADADEDQLTHVAEYERQKVEELDASLRIRAPRNTKELSTTDPGTMETAARARKELKDEIIENTRWSLTQFPTRALAQQAELSHQEYREFAIGACVKDWEAESRKYEQLRDIVDAGSEVHITGEGTDLRFSIGTEDRIDHVGVLSDGTSNVPGGEVFTAPVRDSVEGEIRFELPAITGGREVKGIELTFEDGAVTEFSAEKNEELLAERIDSDEGSGFVGEFGIGTNFDIDRFTSNILFDEKIGGTVHLALGSAYRDCLSRRVDLEALPTVDGDARALAREAERAIRDGRFDRFRDGHDHEAFLERFHAAWQELEDEEEEALNQSAVHYDMIKDLRQGGRFTIDGEVILEDGEFVGVDSL